MMGKQQLNILGLILSAYMFEGCKLAIDRMEAKRAQRQRDARKFMVPGVAKPTPARQIKHALKYRLNAAQAANTRVLDELLSSFSDKDADILNVLAEDATELVMLLAIRPDKAQDILDFARKKAQENE